MRQRAIGAVAAMLLAACGGGGGEQASASDADDADYSFDSRRCDPLRGTGTITNQAGEAAAFRVTVRYTYTSGGGLETQSGTTPVLADGESHQFSIGPDVTGSAPSECRIVGATRIEVNEDDLQDLEAEQAEQPDGSASETEISPIWLVDDVGGSIQDARAHDGVVFISVDAPEGPVLYSSDLATGDIRWYVQPDGDVGAMAPDGRGGVVLSMGSEVVAYDSRGEEAWRTVPLVASETSMPTTPMQLAVHGDAVVVAGGAPGAIAELALGSGDRRWYLHQDEVGSGTPTGFTGGSDLLWVGDDGIVVAGGAGGNKSLVWIDRSGRAPEVVWSLPGAGPRAVVADDVVVAIADEELVVVDAATGQERWRVADPAWERGPSVAPPRIVGEVVVLQTPGRTAAWELESGDDAWATTDGHITLDWTVPADRHVSGTGTAVDGFTVGLQTPTALVLLGEDGTTVLGTLEGGGRSGTLSALEVDGPLVFVAVRGSTNRQSSQMWVLDVRDLAP